MKPLSIVHKKSSVTGIPVAATPECKPWLYFLVIYMTNFNAGVCTTMSGNPETRVKDGFEGDPEHTSYCRLLCRHFRAEQTQV